MSCYPIKGKDRRIAPVRCGGTSSTRTFCLLACLPACLYGRCRQKQLTAVTPASLLRLCPHSRTGIPEQGEIAAKPRLWLKKSEYFKLITENREIGNMELTKLLSQDPVFSALTSTALKEERCCGA